MKKIKIFSKVRNEMRAFGNLANIDKEIEIKNIYDSNNAIKNLEQQILENFKDIKKDEELELYCIATNSILVSITYILKKLGYKFSIIPKSTDSDYWGWTSSPNKEIELNKFITIKSKKEILNRYNKACIILHGKHNIENKSDILYIENNGKNQTIVVNKGKDTSGLNIITVTHTLKLEKDSFKGLESLYTFNLFKNKIDDIFNELLNLNVKEVHIISSIPAIGLLYIGEKILEFKNIKFFIYDYHKNNIYILGSILNN